MTTAHFKYTPLQSAKVVQENLGGAHENLDRELTALAVNTLSSSDLDRKRGGFSIAGMDLSIGLQVSTEVAGIMRVVTNLNMNNAGQWTLVASRTQTFTPATGLTTAGPTSPPVTPNTQNQFVVVAQTGGPPSGGSSSPPSGGSLPPPKTQTGAPAITPITPKTSGSSTSTGGGSIFGTGFVAVVGDPATTQITQQLSQNSISTVISNRVNNLTVNNQSILNVTINNAAAISRTLGTIMAANRIGDQVAHH